MGGISVPIGRDSVNVAAWIVPIRRCDQMLAHAFGNKRLARDRDAMSCRPIGVGIRTSSDVVSPKTERVRLRPPSPQPHLPSRNATQHYAETIARQSLKLQCCRLPTINHSCRINLDAALTARISRQRKMFAFKPISVKKASIARLSGCSPRASTGDDECRRYQPDAADHQARRAKFPGSAAQHERSASRPTTPAIK